MRIFPPDLKTYLDNRLGDGQPSGDPIDTMLFMASGLVGLSEDSDPGTVDLLKSVVVKPWGEPWCADFVQACIAYAENRCGKTSTIPATEGVLDMWAKGQANAVVSPQRGDVVIWRVGDTQEGHCGLVRGVTSLLLSTVEGNTSPPLSGTMSAEQERNGRGVYAKQRAFGGTKTFIQVGFLRCFT